MTAAHDWRHDTGPLDFHDTDALASDPYLRDQAGRFAAKPPRRDRLRPVPDEPTPASNRYVVPAPRCPHGSFARWAAKNCCAPRPPRTRRT